MSAFQIGGSQPCDPGQTTLDGDRGFHHLGAALDLLVRRLSNARYPAKYFTLGLLATTTHKLIDGSPAVGASGAINGVVDMFLVLSPLNGISCLWLGGIWWGSVTFCISSYWMIVLWFVFDIWGAMGAGSGVANWAHIGGFLAGVAVTVAMLQTGMIDMDDRERSLVDIMRGR